MVQEMRMNLREVWKIKYRIRKSGDPEKERKGGHRMKHFSRGPCWDGPEEKKGWASESGEHEPGTSSPCFHDLILSCISCLWTKLLILSMVSWLQVYNPVWIFLVSDLVPVYKLCSFTGSVPDIICTLISTSLELIELEGSRPFIQ